MGERIFFILDLFEEYLLLIELVVFKLYIYIINNKHKMFYDFQRKFSVIFKINKISICLNMAVSFLNVT